MGFGQWFWRLFLVFTGLIVAHVLVVSHGGVIGSLVRDATRWAWPERGVRIENGSDHVFRVRDGRLELISFAGRPWSKDLLPAEEPARTTD